MMPELTTADRFELLDAQYYNKVRSEYRDKTDSVEIDRWTNYGKDRLYINNLKTGDGWVSLKDDDFGGDRWTSCKAVCELDGDELTIKIGSAPNWTYIITVKVHGDGFEADAEPRDIDFESLDSCVRPVWPTLEEIIANNPETFDPDNQEDEIVTDGGEDVTAQISDATIIDAIEADDGPLDDERTATVKEVRDALAWLQQSTEELWEEWVDNIEHDEARVVYEGSDLIIISTGEENIPRRDLRQVYPYDLGERVPDIVSTIHHELAREHCEYDWGYEYPIVVRKPESFKAGQGYIEAVVNSLQKRGLSPGQAWAYYGVEVRDNSRNQWAKRCGYTDHSAVSEAVRKAKKKLPKE